MTVEINSPARPTASARWQDIRTFASQHVDALCMIVLGLVALEYSLNYNLFLQAIPHDTTFHIYAAQQMLEGHPIYRDVAIIKAPLADFITILALVSARIVGITDVMGARLMSLLVAVATTSLTYLTGRVLFNSRIVGLIGGLIMAGWDFYSWRALTGPEPKAFLILFALPALICIAQRRWVLAGVFAALTTLSWQPGLMLVFIALAAAFVEPYLRREKGKSSNDSSRAPHATPGHVAFGSTIVDKSTRQHSAGGGRPLSLALTQSLRVLAGLFVPFLGVLLYLAVNNALAAAYNATIAANLNHFTTTHAGTPLPQVLANNWGLILSLGGQFCFSPLEDWLVYTGTLGFVGIIATEVTQAIRGRRLPITIERTPLILYTLGFAAFSLVDFNFCPDLFPLLPVLALGTGWLVWMLARAASHIATPYLQPRHARLAATAVVALAALIIVGVYLLDVRGYRLTGTTFQDQMDIVQIAQTYLEPGDRVLSFGNTIVQVELHRTNPTKILHLGSKSGLGVLASEPGGLQGLIDELDRDPPKLVTLARENKPDWTIPLYDWLNRRYDPAESFPRANMRFMILKQ